MTAFASTLGPSAYWYLTRGTGAVSLVLLTSASCSGSAARCGRRPSGGRASRSTPSTATCRCWCIVVLAVHIITSVLDSFAPIGWLDAVIPFTPPTGRCGSASGRSPSTCCWR